MAFDKVVDSAALDAGLLEIANAIREKSGGNGTLEFPNGMSAAVRAINGLETEITEFCGINDTVQSYLAAAAVYTDDDRSTTVISDYVSASQTATDKPADAIITNKTVGTLYVLDETTCGCYSQKVTSVKERPIRNLIPGHICTWFVKDSNGTVTCSGRLKQTGSLRMILLDGIFNVRDLGGWACDGGTVKYGKLFRGGASGNTATSDAITKAMQLGIRREIDLREGTEHSKTKSSLGANVHYVNSSLSKYYYDLIADTDTDRDNLVLALRSIMESAIYNEAVWFHCSVGADRTGTVSYLIEGLLGLSKRDMDKDYELTSFYPYGEQVRMRTKAEYVAMIDYLDTFDGNTFRDKVASWFVSAGFSYDELNAFCAAMVDGTPSELVEPAGSDEPAYTNLVPTSEALDSTDIYNGGLGYRNGYYISSSGGTDSTKSGHVTTGLIPWELSSGVVDDPIYIKGGKLSRLAIYGAEKNFRSTIASTVTAQITIEQLDADYYKVSPVVLENGNTNIFGTYGQVSYFRLDVECTDGANLIVTVGEPIV